jgi:hypothetical protein
MGKLKPGNKSSIPIPQEASNLPATVTLDAQQGQVDHSFDWLYQLPPIPQQTLTLRMLGYSLDEIAARCKCSKPAVWDMILRHAPATGLPALTLAQQQAILAARFRHLAHKALDEAGNPAKLAKASASQAAVISAIATDKAAMLAGSPGREDAETDTIEVRLRAKLRNRADGVLPPHSSPTDDNTASNH